MPDTPMEVVVYGKDDGPDDGIEFVGITHISLVNSGTFGKPALIAPGDDHIRGAKRVLYVNTTLCKVWEVDKP